MKFFLVLVILNILFNTSNGQDGPIHHSNSCLSSSSCSTGQICSNYQCVPCNDSNCQQTYTWSKRCYSDTCVECTENPDCPAGGGLTCITTGMLANKCGITPCSTNADCPSSRPNCVGSGPKYCVACELDTECSTWSNKSLYSCHNGLCTTICYIHPSSCSDPTRPVCTAIIEVIPGYCVQCNVNGDCSNSSSVCSSSNTCVQCLTSNDCNSISTPFCSQSNNTCIPCSQDSDCHFSNTPKCSSSRQCVQCLSDNDCSSTTPKCLQSNNSCVYCLSSNDCNSTSASKCTVAANPSYTCTACSLDSDCIHLSGMNGCQQHVGECVECYKNQQCLPQFTAAQCNHTSMTCVNDSPGCSQQSTSACNTQDYPVCDFTVNRCARCSRDQDCSQLSIATRCLINNATGVNTCVQCMSDADCNATNGMFCDTGTNTCTSTTCSTAANCLSSTPSFPQCLNSTCMKCTSSSQCETFNSSFPICYSQTGNCESQYPSCTTNDNCIDPSLAFCNGSYCQPCLSNINCSSRFNKTFPAFCDTSTGTGTCKQCLGNLDCPNINASYCSFGVCSPCQSYLQCNHTGLPLCDSGTCVNCISNNDCQQPSASRCDTSNTFMCQKCLNDGDCSLISSNPYCDATLGCVECRDDTDCTTSPNLQCSVQHQCYTCPINNCLTCAPNNTVCLACKTGYFGYNNNQQCVNPCPSGYWGNNQAQTCDPCNITCKTCQSGANICTSCFNPYVLDSSLCKTKAPSPTAILTTTSDPQVFLLVFSTTMNITGDISRYLQFTFSNLASPTDFTLNNTESQPDGKTFKFTFTFYESAGIENLTVLFVNQSQIVDHNGVITTQQSASTQTIEFTYFTPSERTTVQNLATIGTAVSSAALASSISLLVTGGAGGILWSFLGFFQIVNYLLYLNVNYPQNVVLFFKLFSVSSINAMVPNPIQYVAPTIYQEMQIGLTSPPKFSDNGMDGLFLNNGGSTIAGWVGLVALYILTKILLFIFRTTGRLNNLLYWFKNKFEWGMVYGSIMGSYADLLIAVALQFNNMNFQTGLNTFSSVLALITGGLCFWTPFASIAGVESTSYELGSKMHKSKHGVVYQDFKIHQEGDVEPGLSYYRRNFMAFIFLRKIAYFCGIVLAYDIPMLQMTITCCSGLVLLLFLFKIKPYEETRDVWMNVGSEVIILLIHLVIFIFAGDDITLKMTDTQRKNVGWVVVGLCSLLILYNVCFIFVLQILQIIKFIKFIKRKICKKKQKELPNSHRNTNRVTRRILDDRLSLPRHKKFAENEEIQQRPKAPLRKPYYKKQAIRRNNMITNIIVRSPKNKTPSS